jgi:hypothetical protein
MNKPERKILRTVKPIDINFASIIKSTGSLQIYPDRTAGDSKIGLNSGLANDRRYTGKWMDCRSEIKITEGLFNADTGKLFRAFLF